MCTLFSTLYVFVSAVPNHPLTCFIFCCSSFWVHPQSPPFIPTNPQSHFPLGCISPLILMKFHASCCLKTGNPKGWVWNGGKLTFSQRVRWEDWCRFNVDMPSSGGLRMFKGPAVYGGEPACRELWYIYILEGPLLCFILYRGIQQGTLPKVNVAGL